MKCAKTLYFKTSLNVGLGFLLEKIDDIDLKKLSNLECCKYDMSINGCYINNISYLDKKSDLQLILELLTI